MRVLVVGGSGSGKSAFAEKLACQLSQKRTYVATMSAQGTEARERIARHHAQRAGRRFVTLECLGTLPAQAPSPEAARGVVLVDDVGNLVANALFDARGTMGDPHATCERLAHESLALAQNYAHAVFVGNEAGCEGAFESEATMAWLRTSGALCCKLADSFDVVVEVCAGVSTVVKGVLSWS